MATQRRRKKKNKYTAVRLLYAVIAVVLIFALFVSIDFAFEVPWLPFFRESAPEATATPYVTATPLPTPTEDPTPHVTGTATLASVGDMLIHTPIIRNAKKGDSYDFSQIYTKITPYYEQYDWMVANLEVTLGGTEAGSYTGYPIFNCPDTILDAIQASGVDMLLTSNNHSYDTREAGFLRTQEKLNEKNIPYIGTRLDPSAPYYRVQDINGVKIGMTCYTYETKVSDNGHKTLNGLVMTEKAGALCNSFNYDDLDSFYSDVTQTLTEMKKAGAQYTVFYLHWGNEYTTKPISKQTAIAQKLCDLGVDAIIGGHPHVVEPFEVLQSDSGHEMLCLYSMGNAVSNQRRELMDSSPKGYTEDGVIFSLTLDGYSDGTAKVRDVNILPTWVAKDYNGKENVYTILPLDAAKRSQWNAKMKESYARTMSIVGDGLNAYKEQLGLDAVPLT